MYSNLVMVVVLLVAVLVLASAQIVSYGAAGAHPGLAYSSNARAQISRAGLVYGGYGFY